MHDREELKRQMGIESERPLFEMKGTTLVFNAGTPKQAREFESVKRELVRAGKGEPEAVNTMLGVRAPSSTPKLRVVRGPSKREVIARCEAVIESCKRTIGNPDSTIGEIRAARARRSEAEALLKEARCA